MKFNGKLFKILGLMCFIAVVSMLSFVGCNTTKYGNMQLVFLTNVDNATIQITRQENTDTETFYPVSEIYSLELLVSGDKGINKEVVVTGTNGLVNYTLNYLGEGKTRIDFTALTSGSTTINISTKEGGLHKSFKLNVCNSLYVMSFNNSVNAFEKGVDIDLGSTSSKYLNFTSAIIGNPSIYELLYTVETKKTSVIDSDFIARDENAYFTGSILHLINNKNYDRIKVTAKAKKNSAEFYTDKDGKELSATKEFQVLEIEKNLSLYMNYGENPLESKLMEVKKNPNGLFEIILADPKFGKNGNLSNDYLLRRLMFFKVGNEWQNNGSYNFSVYSTITLGENGIKEELEKLHSDSTNDIITINDSKNTTIKVGEEEKSLNGFAISAKGSSAENYVIKRFKVSYNDYTGFDQFIDVKFVIRSIPEKITINNGSKETIKIFNKYDNRGFIEGTEIKLNVDNKYAGMYFYVALRSDDAIFDDQLQLVDKNILMYDSSGKALTFANRIGSQFNYELASKIAIDLKGETSIYVKHNYPNDQIPKQNIDLVFIFAYDVKPSYIDKDENYKIYTIQEVIQANLFLGITKFDNLVKKRDLNIVYDNNKLINIFEVAGNNCAIDLINAISLDETLGKIVYGDKGDVDPNSLKRENLINLQINDNYEYGTFTILLKAYNGYKESIIINVYAPMFYTPKFDEGFGYTLLPEEVDVRYLTSQYYGSSFDAERKYDTSQFTPLAVETIEKNEGVLDVVDYTYSTIKDAEGNETIEKVDKFNILYPSSRKSLDEGYHVDNYGTYSSIFEMSVVAGSSIPLNVYNFICNPVTKLYQKVNINSKCSIKNEGAFSWNNGVLNIEQTITPNGSSPFELVFKYKDYVELVDGEGTSFVEQVSINFTIKIYVYKSLNKVNVTNGKNVTLYEKSSLGENNVDKSIHKIEYSVSPLLNELGRDSHVETKFICDEQKVLARLKKYASTEMVDVRISDLCEINKNTGELRAIVGKDIKDKLLLANVADLFNSVENNRYEFYILIEVRQFNKLIATDTVKIIIEYAMQVESISLSIDKEGLYFENLNEVKEVSFAVYPTNALNRKIRIEYNNTFFTTYLDKECTIETNGVVDPGIYSNTGRFYVKSNNNPCGKEKLVIAADDGYLLAEKDGATYITHGRVSKQYSINIANGTEKYPFQIRSGSDFTKMMSKIKNGQNDFYVLTKDIDIYDNISNITFSNKTSSFQLDGKYEYNYDGLTYIKYSTIYGVKINNVVGQLAGLFTEVPACASFINLSIENAIVDIKDVLVNNTSIGVLGGSFSGNFINSSISATMRVCTNGYSVNVGTIAGLLVDGTINNSIKKYIIGGTPVGAISGFAESFNNIKSTIEIISAKENLNRVLVGGVAGKILGKSTGNIELGDFYDLKILVNIINNGDLTKNAVIGGFSGIIETANINNVKVYPKINKGNIVGGLFGQVEQQNDDKNLTLNNVYVYFANGQIKGIGATSIIGTKYIGGLIGEVTCLSNINPLNKITFTNSFARSFTAKDINHVDKDALYYGNIFADTTNSTDSNVTFIGGLIGSIGEKVTISIDKSYFIADMSSAKMLNNYGDSDLNSIVTNLFIGDISSSSVVSIKDCFSKGKIGKTPATNSLFTNILDTSAPDTVITSGYSTQDNSIELSKPQYNNIDIKNYYGVLNNNFFTIINTKRKANTISSTTGNFELNQYVNAIVKTNNKILTINDYFESFGFKIADGTKEIAGTGAVWFANSTNADLNQLFPVILKVDKGAQYTVLYDILPDKVKAVVYDYFNNNIHSWTNQGYLDVTNGGETSKVVLMYNKTSTNIKDDNLYLLAFDNETINVGDKTEQYKVLNITLQGSTSKIKFVNLYMNNDLTIKEDSDGTVISISSYFLRVMAPGKATITIQSDLDNSVYTTVDIVVVAGVMDYDLIRLSTGDEINNTASTTNINNTIYINNDETFHLKANNSVENVLYLTNPNIGYLVQILDAGANASIIYQDKEISYKKPTVANGSEVANNTDMQFYNDKNGGNLIKIGVDGKFTIKGKTVGLFSFKVIPFIDLNAVGGLENFYEKLPLKTNEVLINGLSKNYCFDVINKAESIQSTNAKEAAISPSGNITLNIEVKTGSPNENVYLVIYNAKNQVLTEEEINNLVTNKKNEDKILKKSQTQSAYSLLQYNVKDIVIPQSIEKDGYYTITYKVDFSFNKDEYRKNPEKYNLNNEFYTLYFITGSNTSKYIKFNYKINPLETTIINTNFYPRGEMNQDIYMPNEYENSFIAPGRDGLLKVAINPEFCDTDYIIVSVPIEYKTFIVFNQKIAQIDNSKDSFIIGYKDVPYKEIIETDTSYGIILNKKTSEINKDNDFYSQFNNIYYVSIKLNENIKQGLDIPFNIMPYKFNGTIDEPLFKVAHIHKLTVQPLPSVSLTIDEKTYNVALKGSKTELTLNASNYDNTISYSIEHFNQEAGAYYIIDELGNIMSGEFNAKSGLKYFLVVNNNAKCDKSTNLHGKNDKPNSSIKITVKAKRNINGIMEFYESDLFVKFIEMEIDNDKIGINNADNSIMSKPLGTTEQLLINLSNAMKNDNYLLDKQGNIIIDEFGNKIKISTIIAKMWSGFSGVETINLMDGNKHYIDYNINADSYKSRNDYINLWVQEINKNGEIFRESLKTNDNNNLNFMFKRTENTDLNYYYIASKKVSNDSVLGIDIYYTYNENGKPMQITEQESKLVELAHKVSLSFNLNITENSTYDAPNPIYNVSDLMALKDKPSGHFILLNNLEVDNWEPFDCNFNSLDGNGYVIKINSFNFDKYRKNEVKTKYAGFFSTINQGSVLKNMTFDISPMLISEEEMNRNIENVNLIQPNYLVDTYKAQGKIDLSFVDNTIFGLIAGQNKGSITNSKVVNMEIDTTKVDNKNSILHVLSFQGYSAGQSLYNNTIGGIVGENTNSTLENNGGAITNSYIGIGENDSKISVIDSSISKYYTINDLSKESIEIDDARKITDNRIVYPFTLAGGRKLAGVVGINSGVISAVSVKGLSLINTMEFTNDQNQKINLTGGIAVENTTSGIIISTYIENQKLKNYRPDYSLGFTSDKIDLINTIGYVGVFAYSNAGIIKNCYSSMIVNNNATNSAGFVFLNSGSIYTSYSASIHRKIITHNETQGGTTAYGDFVGENDITSFNTGSISNCFYLIDTLNNETKNPLQDADGIEIANENGNDDICQAGLATSYTGFNFGGSNNAGASWIMPKKGTLPRLNETLNMVASFRQLDKIDSIDSNNDGEAELKYSFTYNTELGNKNNPILIDNGIHFITYILDFAKNNSHTNNSSYRIINNLYFNKLSFNEPDTINRDYKLYDVMFKGKISGNGMTLYNLKWNNNEDRTSFGLFKELDGATINDLNFYVTNFSAKNSNKVGVIAGQVSNSILSNIEVSTSIKLENINPEILESSTNVYITGKNLVGGIAGLISNSTLYDIRVKNVAIVSTYSSIAQFNDSSYDKTGKFNFAFNLIKDDSTYKRISYAGAIAGAIINNKEVVINNSVQGTEKATDGTSKTSKLFAYSTYRGSTPTEKTKIYNITVSENIVIVGENVGGITGYLGENCIIKQGKFILSQENSQVLYGENFTGGIVGENHGMLNQVYVEHIDSVQKNIDVNLTNGSIISSNTIFGNSPIFKNAIDQVNVAIGGIAGYSNGVIIDSYAKVNVINPYAKIAGGIIGYAENYNYLAFVYTTGDIMGKHVTGGAIGFYTYITNYDMYLRSVTAVNSWSSQIVDKLKINQTQLYPNELANIKVRMPQIGNQQLTATEYTYLDELNNQKTTSFKSFIIKSQLDGKGKSYYYLSEIAGKNNGGKISYDSDLMYNPASNKGIFHYVGSVLGKVTSLNDNDYTMYNDKILFAHNDDNIVDYSKQFAYGVYSTTYGQLTNSGSIESGTYQNSYSESSCEINDANYDYTYFDKRADYKKDENLAKVYGQTYFKNIFGYQEHLTQIIGKFVGTSNSSEIANYKNLFVNYYNKNNRTQSVNTGSFDGMFYNKVDLDSVTNKIWGVKTGEFLPSKNFGMFSNVIIIDSQNKLNNALSTPSNNMTYYLVKNKDINSGGRYNINCNNGNLYQYELAFNGIIIGRKESGDKDYPIIDIKISTATSLFNEINSATITNVNFNIILTNDGLIFGNSNTKIINDVGLLSNNVINSNISNITVNLNANNKKLIFNKNVKNVGLVFGKILNTDSTNLTINIDNNENILNKDETVSSEKVLNNFGLACGVINNSNIIALNILANKTTYIGEIIHKNMGGISGSIVGSNLKNCKSTVSFKTNDKPSVITDNIVNSDKVVNIAVGGISGSLSMSKLIECNSEYSIDINTLNNDSIDINFNNITKDIVNIGGLCGISDASNFYGSYASTFIPSDDRKIQIGNIINKNISSDGKIYSIKLQSSYQANVGGLVGSATNGTIFSKYEIFGEIKYTYHNGRIYNNTDNNISNVGGICGLYNAGGSASNVFDYVYAIGDIMTSAKEIKINKMNSSNIGGIIGFAQNSPKLSNVYYYGNIVGNGNFHSHKITDLNTDISNIYLTSQNIGGLVGCGLVKIDKFISYGDIYYMSTGKVTADGTNKVNNKLLTVSCKIGGIVGGNSSALVKNGINYTRIQNKSIDGVFDNNSIYSLAYDIIEGSYNVFTIREFIKTINDYTMLNNAVEKSLVNIINYANISDIKIDGFVSYVDSLNINNNRPYLIGNIDIINKITSLETNNTCFDLLMNKFTPNTTSIEKGSYNVIKNSQTSVLNIGADEIDGIISGYLSISGYPNVAFSGSLNIGLNGALCGFNVLYGSVDIINSGIVGNKITTFVFDNYGVISDISFYGEDRSTNLASNIYSAFAGTNNGLIARSSTMIVYGEGQKDVEDNTNIINKYGENSSFFVGINGENGAISDCYTLSFTYFREYSGFGIARENNGVIKNVFHSSTKDAKFHSIKENAADSIYYIIGTGKGSSYNVICGIENDVVTNKLINLDYNFMANYHFVWSKNILENNAINYDKNFGLPYITTFNPINSNIIKNVTLVDNGCKTIIEDAYYEKKSNKNNVNVEFFQNSTGSDVVISNKLQFVEFFKKYNNKEFSGIALINEDIDLSGTLFEYQIKNLTGKIYSQKGLNKYPVSINGLKLNKPLINKISASGQFVEVKIINANTSSNAIITNENYGSIINIDISSSHINYMLDTSGVKANAIGLVAGINKGAGNGLGIYGCTINNCSIKTTQYQTIGGVVGINDGFVGGYVNVVQNKISPVNAVVGLTITEDVQIDIKENIYIGGVVGLNTHTIGKYIKLEGITIKASSTNFVGGAVGFSKTSFGIYSIKDSNIYGNFAVGGIVGMIGKDVMVKDISNDTINYISNTDNKIGLKYGDVENVTVKGNSYIGGVVGLGDIRAKVLITISKVSVNAVNEKSFAGGLTGAGQIDCTNIITSNNCSVQSGGYAGGVSGLISANNKVETITSSESIWQSNCKIIGRVSGGVVGLIESKIDTQRLASINNCKIVNCTIGQSNSNFTGGIIGESKSAIVTLKGNSITTYSAPTVTEGSLSSSELIGATVGGLIGVVEGIGSRIGNGTESNINYEFINNNVKDVRFKSSTIAGGIIGAINNGNEIDINGDILLLPNGNLHGITKDDVSNNSYIVENSGFGLLVGTLRVSSISNCVSDGVYYDKNKLQNYEELNGLEILSNIGGICAESNNSAIINCSNSAIIRGLSTVGGICAISKNQTSILDTTNDGNIFSKTGDVGGIVGIVTNDKQFDSNSSVIKNCTNNKDIKTDTGLNIGGIVGNGRVLILDEVTFTGNITSNTTANVGGIIGSTNVNSDVPPSVELKNNITVNNVNSNIYTNGQYVGGVGGFVYLNMSNTPLIKVSLNNIQGDKYVGAVYGQLIGNEKDIHYTSVLVNFKNLSANSYASGFAGKAALKDNSSLTFATINQMKQESSGKIINLGVDINKAAKSYEAIQNNANKNIDNNYIDKGLCAIGIFDTNMANGGIMAYNEENLKFGKFYEDWGKKVAHTDDNFVKYNYKNIGLEDFLVKETYDIQSNLGKGYTFGKALGNNSEYLDGELMNIKILVGPDNYESCKKEYIKTISDTYTELILAEKTYDLKGNHFIDLTFNVINQTATLNILNKTDPKGYKIDIITKVISTIKYHVEGQIGGSNNLEKQAVISKHMVNRFNYDNTKPSPSISYREITESDMVEVKKHDNSQHLRNNGLNYYFKDATRIHNNIAKKFIIEDDQLTLYDINNNGVVEKYYLFATNDDWDFDSDENNPPISVGQITGGTTKWKDYDSSGWSDYHPNCTFAQRNYKEPGSGLFDGKTWWANYFGEGGISGHNDSTTTDPISINLDDACYLITGSISKPI